MSIDNLFPPDGYRTTDWRTPIVFNATDVDIDTLNVLINSVPIITNGVLVSDNYAYTLYEIGTDDYQITLIPISKLAAIPYSIIANATDKYATSTLGTATYGTNTYGG